MDDKNLKKWEEKAVKEGKRKSHQAKFAKIRDFFKGDPLTAVFCTFVIALSAVGLTGMIKLTVDNLDKNDKLFNDVQEAKIVGEFEQSKTDDSKKGYSLVAQGYEEINL